MTAYTDFYDIEKSGKKYKIIYCDAPWQYDDTGIDGGTETHYETMNLQSIMQLPVNAIADDNCVLFMWCTWAMLPECLAVIDSWQFKYKTKGFVWIKTNKNKGYHFGTGHYTRGNSEFCLIATKGKPKRISKRVFELVISPRTKHSTKPDVVRKRITQLYGELPRIELFARSQIHGWDVFGNDEKIKDNPLEVFQ